MGDSTSSLIPSSHKGGIIVSYSRFILIGLCAGMFSAAAIALILDVYRFFKERHKK
jgi:hypothetical protein